MLAFLIIICIWLACIYHLPYTSFPQISNIASSFSLIALGPFLQCAHLPHPILHLSPHLTLHHSAVPQSLPVMPCLETIPYPLITPSEPNWVYASIEPYNLLLSILATPLAYQWSQKHSQRADMVWGGVLEYDTPCHHIMWRLHQQKESVTCIMYLPHVGCDGGVIPIHLSSFTWLHPRSFTACLRSIQLLWSSNCSSKISTSQCEK